jgi:hypothetical protein
MLRQLNIELRPEPNDGTFVVEEHDQAGTPTVVRGPDRVVSKHVRSISEQGRSVRLSVEQGANDFGVERSG